ncbi:hypothetical protein Ahy_B01g052531 [Arachis hypogaea]|uniref:Aminotransferase-like plant mobile domain-containing protein n=1 Tax=Arachis hypogaea TaxID=3818 RepID=A0A445APV2_ARAHY|nr:hypothetical protein Ahy_B01g052531 [Arachis hypogaea]
MAKVKAGHIGITKFNIKLKWLRARLQHMPFDLPDNALIQYARCYILYLLGGVLLSNKANNTVHAPNVTTLYSFPLAIRWAGKKGQKDYAEQCLLRHRQRLDNLQVDEFNWLPYMDPRFLSRVFTEFLSHPHEDFYTAVVPLILFKWIEILNKDKVLH